MNKLLKIAASILGLAGVAFAGPSSPPAGNYILNKSTIAASPAFSVSSGTISTQLNLGYGTQGSLLYLSTSGVVATTSTLVTGGDVYKASTQTFTGTNTFVSSTTFNKQVKVQTTATAGQGTGTGGSILVVATDETGMPVQIYTSSANQAGYFGLINLIASNTGYANASIYITGASSSTAKADLYINNPRPNIQLYQTGGASPYGQYEFVVTGDTLQFNAMNSGGSAQKARLGMTHAGALAFYETSDNGHFIALKASATIASNVTWLLPAADGTINQVLATNGAGTLSWVTQSGSGGGGLNLQPSTATVTISSSLAFSGDLGSAGQILASQGPGTVPRWITASGTGDAILASTQVWSGGNTYRSSSTFNGAIIGSTLTVRGPIGVHAVGTSANSVPQLDLEDDTYGKILQFRTSSLFGSAASYIYSPTLYFSTSTSSSVTPLTVNNTGVILGTAGGPNDQGLRFSSVDGTQNLYFINDATGGDNDVIAGCTGFGNCILDLSGTVLKPGVFNSSQTYRFMTSDSSGYTSNYNLLGGGNTWTGANTYQSTTTFNGAVNVSTSLHLSGSAGVSGQVVTSGGPGASVTWTTPSGGGSSSLAVTTGTSAGVTGAFISSPTAIVVFDSRTTNGQLTGSATYFFSLRTDSATLQGNLYSISGIASSTGTLSASTNTLQSLVNGKVAYSSFSATNPIQYNSATGALSLSAVSLATGTSGILPSGSMVSTAAFTNSTQTWTAGQTHTSSVTLNGAVIVSTSISAGGVGTNGQFLTSGGPGAVVSWTTASGSGGGVITPSSFTWNGVIVSSLQVVGGITASTISISSNSVMPGTTFYGGGGPAVIDMVTISTIQTTLYTTTVNTNTFVIQSTDNLTMMRVDNTHVNRGDFLLTISSTPSNNGVIGSTLTSVDTQGNLVVLGSGTFPGGLVGTITNNNAASGIIGETSITQGTNKGCGATGVWVDLATATLTAGDYLVFGQAENQLNAATITSWGIGLGTTGGNSDPGTVGQDKMFYLPPTATTDMGGIVLKRFSLSGSSSMYLKVVCTLSAGDTNFNGFTLEAIRIR